LDDVVTGRVPDPHPPVGNKALGAIVFGALTAEISKESFKQLTAFLSQRLGEKASTVKVKVKAPDGREIEIEVNDKSVTFDSAMQKAQDFINNQKDKD
jgi:F0F1-type ATP synthase delta subunit